MDDLKKRDFLPKLNFNDKRTPQEVHDQTHVSRQDHEVGEKTHNNATDKTEDSEKKPEDEPDKESEIVGPLEEILKESKIDEEKDEEITEAKKEAPEANEDSSPPEEPEAEQKTSSNEQEDRSEDQNSQNLPPKRIPIDRVLEEVLQSLPEDRAEGTKCTNLPNADALEECTSLPLEESTSEVEKSTEDENEEILNIILLKPGDGKNYPTVKTEPSEDIPKISEDQSKNQQAKQRPEAAESQPEVTEAQPEVISASEMEIEYFEEDEDEIQEVSLDQSEDENAQHDDDPIDLLVIKSDLSYLRDDLNSAPAKRKAPDSSPKGPIKKRKMENLYSLIVQMLEPNPTPFSFNCHVNECDFSANHIEDLESHIRNSHRTSETIRYRSQSQYLRFQCDKCGVR